MTDDGGPAYPYPSTEIYETGMSLRDYFARGAMQGMMASSPEGGEFPMVADEDMDGRDPCDVVASISYDIADAMLKARKKPNERKPLERFTSKTQ